MTISWSKPIEKQESGVFCQVPPKSPLAFKQSLEQRLLNGAKAKNVDVQRLRQFALYERFLARIFRVFQEKVILKGGIVLALRHPEARTTKDVDLSLHENPNSIAAKLQEACRLELDDYFTFTIKPDNKNPIIVTEGMPYPGARFRAEGFLAGRIYGSSFGVDIVFSEPKIKEAETWPQKSTFDFAEIDGPILRICSIEVHLAEKLHAYTQPRTHVNSRVKDLPDIALLAMLGRLDSQSLLPVLQKSFSERKSHPLPERMPEPPEAWEQKYAAMAKLERLPWKSLAEVYTASSSFFNPLLAGHSGHWEPNTWSWC